MDFANFPVDIIILALVAGFLILRLRSVLGKKTGFNKEDRVAAPTSRSSNMQQVMSNNQDKPTEPVKPKVEVNVPAPETEVGQALSKITQLDASFSTQKFVDGAEIVFRKVLTAFSAEDLPVLQSMLVVDAYNAFESAIIARRNLQQKQTIEIKSIHSITINKAQVIEDAAVNRAIIEVQFISNQINCTFDKDNNPVTGTESVTEFIDFWTFERLLGVNSQGISWRLKSARSGN
ncbi:Tim44/TimA family putative adaptor protein [Commensalibacter papalotli (ex Botero et al. 2024)]|uniref:Tim44 family (Tim44) (PDB:2CW9) n=1 Tax=Commensalibacter papalotli (ex Botero et al. 2024) TaxID=2972766 RepID=A0ABM9HJL5_9PROT|nr:Tim44/TimA family putative adaptor protein [Commensalibacter papalotli (ex Botero et al. 2024)]CAI3923689.1 Predicted lipid-binding transport protein [Commensalibacter papalotli (ex Botero et al. 2024)]CAI3928331.1 Predicted lipid-binding transport protein [Commensalibacter papalotli (ex Botero et al. 2024)]